MSGHRHDYKGEKEKACWLKLSYVCICITTLGMGEKACWMKLLLSVHRFNYRAERGVSMLVQTYLYVHMHNYIGNGRESMWDETVDICA